MLHVTRIMDRIHYEKKDEKFVKNFIKENERVFRKMRYRFNGSKYDEVHSFYITPTRENFLRIKRLEKLINSKSRTIKIKVEENGILVMKE